MPQKKQSRSQSDGYQANFPNLKKRKGVLCTLVFSCGVLIFTPLFAQDLSPMGKWKTVSDKTGKATSIVKISLVNGELVGVVDDLLGKRKNPNPVCKECEGEQKNQPIKGLKILWGLKHDGDEWNGGYILDPDNGTSYRCIVTVGEKGEKLHVRGYIGFSLFGRTQVWLRAE